MITLKELCEELKIDPKEARKRLRASDDPKVKASRKPGTPWQWQKGSAAEKAARSTLMGAD